MNYRLMNENDMDEVVKKYIQYYNTAEECCWTYEKAFRRIHQVMSMEGALCLVQVNEADELVGFLMGYVKEYDDILGYFLDEIVIFLGNQNRKYGTLFIEELEKRLKSSNVACIELNSVNDDAHKHFYSKAGFYEANNFIPMGKFIE